jgi:hypothetical protein
MPRLDILHEIVKQAIIKDGWTITHDPFPIAFGLRRVYTDLGAEKVIAAEKRDQKIAVEIKSFVGISTVTDLERAIGQYAIYKSWLTRVEPERMLYLAVDEDIFNDIFQDISGQVLLEDYGIKLVVVNKEREEILQWVD